MAGHSRPKDGVASLAYVPAIHVFLVRLRKQDVDARDKRGHDGGVCCKFHEKCSDGAGPRTWPDRTACNSEPVVLNIESMRLVTRSFIAPAATPRYGTWVMSMPAAFLSNSAVRCGVVPMPGVAKVILPGLALARAI